VLPLPDAGNGSHHRFARALTSQKMVLELLLADMPEHEYTLNNKSDVWARNLKVGKPRFKARVQPKADLSHPAMAVNLDACIQCTRCVRACREEQVNDVIGYAGRETSRKSCSTSTTRWRVHLRGLRRVRAGLPDRRADAGARRRPAGPSTRRSTRCARSAASAACSHTT